MYTKYPVLLTWETTVWVYMMCAHSASSHLEAVQKIPGNHMSDEENTRYSKQTQTKNQELRFKSI